MSDTQSAASARFWQAVRHLLHARWLIVGATAAVAIGSVIISLLLTNWYRADVRMLLAGRSSAGLVSSLMGGQLSPTATSLLGGLVSDYQRQLAILYSRSVTDSVITAFDLIEVYDLSDSKFPMLDAREMLQENVDFVVDDEYNYLSVRVFDTDPQRAADMANYFAAELNRVTSELATETAGTYRQVVEDLYGSIESGIDSVFTSMQDLQQRTGVLDLPTQGATFMESLGRLRQEIWLAEINYKSLLYAFGEDNSQVRAAREALDTANETYEDALAGQERLMPVPQDSLPDIAREFQELEKERIILTTMVEFARPILEQARLEEQLQADAVQIVDPAMPPDKKARPWRAAIVVVSTTSGFMIVCLFVLARAWWRRNHQLIAARLAGDSDG